MSIVTVADNVLGTNEKLPRDRMVYRAVRKVHEEVLHSPFPHMPLIFSEYNASYANEPDVTDTVYMGAWLAGTISQCDGLTEAMAYWSFSDAFEESAHRVKAALLPMAALTTLASEPAPATPISGRAEIRLVK